MRKAQIDSVGRSAVAVINDVTPTCSQTWRHLRKRPPLPSATPSPHCAAARTPTATPSATGDGYFHSASDADANVHRHLPATPTVPRLLRRPRAPRLTRARPAPSSQHRRKPPRQASRPPPEPPVNPPVCPVLRRCLPSDLPPPWRELMRRLLLASVPLAILFGAAACGDGADEDPGVEPTATVFATPTTGSNEQPQVPDTPVAQPTPIPTICRSSR
jgi:hypothetical protein